MSLKKGWNQIGNPYTTQIVWSDVLTYNGNPAGVSNLSKFNGQYFVDPTGTIDPFEGGFVQVENDVTLQIPFKGFTTGGRTRNTIASSDIDKSSWLVSFTLQQSGLVYSLGSIGMDPDAKLSKDVFDLITPPNLSEFTEINFAHPEHFMQRFTRDVVPTQDEFQWEFTINSNVVGMAELTWDPTSFGEGTKDLFLFDLGNQKLIDMRINSDHTFNPEESSKFKVFYGDKLKNKIMPDVISLGNPYPNPSAGISSIDYTLPGTVKNYTVQLEVFDNLGKSIKVLASGVREAGFYTEQWDAGEYPNGMYTCRLTVTSGKEKEAVSKRIIINK
ncbi:MAG: T9SS type A sorting domain-containing protein [Cyclobacteriaceae bacterium]